MANKAKKDEKTKSSKPYRVAKKIYTYVELQHMTEAELKSVKKLLRDNVTRNLRKLQKGGFKETPATIGLATAIESGIVPQMPHINITPPKPKNEPKKKKKKTELTEKQRLMGEIFEYQKYQASSTGTLAGMKKFENDANERIGDAYRDSSLESKRKFWKLYDEQRETIENNDLGSTELQKKLADFFSSKNGKRITKQRREEWEKIVEEASEKAMLEEAEAKKNEPKLTPFKITKI